MFHCLHTVLICVDVVVVVVIKQGLSFRFRIGSEHIRGQRTVAQKIFNQ